MAPLTFPAVTPKEFLEDIANSVNLLSVAIIKIGITVPEDLQKEVLKACVSQHVDHVTTLKINQHTIDPYKVITWYGFILAEKIGGNGSKRDVIKATIQTLDYCLSEEQPLGGLPQNILGYMEDFVVNELENKPHCGIGKNGLFLAFHTASTMKRKASRSFNAGWSGSKSLLS
jgi:hypothetical protein